jgi:2-polyprenyl-6-methoxyphenol hydroxylase-like FAD-dependent oxidoreductase
MQVEATELIRDGDRVKGIKADTPDGPLAVNADLVIGADGRNSVVREQSGLRVDEVGAPIDVFWFRLSRRSSDTAETAGRFDPGSIMVMINRGDYWQCAFVIPKGAAEKVREADLPAFRDTVCKLAPFISDRVSELQSWDDVKLLTVRIDRLRQWFRQVCCASVTRPMGCPRSAAWASTLPFRTRLRRPISYLGHCRMGSCPRTT